MSVIRSLLSLTTCCRTMRTFAAAWQPVVMQTASISEALPDAIDTVSASLPLDMKIGRGDVELSRPDPRNRRHQRYCSKRACRHVQLYCNEVGAFLIPPGPRRPIDYNE